MVGQVTAKIQYGNFTNFAGFQIENVPEPSTYAMLGIAGALCVGVTLRRRRA